MEIRQDFIPVGRPNRPRYAMKPLYITVHNTANTAKGADALAHAKFLKTTNAMSSWHFTVDDKRAVQHLPLNENGWHCGDGNGTGNRKSIGVEVCENVDGNIVQAEKNAQILVAKIMKEQGILLSNVVPHKKWSGKNCPSRILPHWNEFIQGVQAEYVKLTALYKLLVAGKQVGAYSVKDNALAEGWKLHNAGNKDVVMITPEQWKYTFALHEAENPVKTTPKQEPTQPKVIQNPIMGKAEAKVEQMALFVKGQNPNFDPTIAKTYLEIGAKYGVKGDVAFAQAVLETHYFLFDSGTAITPDQFNYYGCGAIQKGVKGDSFKSMREGVTAHIQHLYAYASTSELPQGESLVDPRFKYVTRGIAPGWEDLNNRWAMNDQYGQNILDLHKRMLATVVPAEPVVPDSVPTWAREAVKKAMVKGVLTDPKGSEDLYRILVILDRLELLK